MSDATQSAQIARVRAAFERIPHCRHLGMQLTELMPGWGMMTLPYSPRLIGDPRRGVVHGGVITALLDTLCGVVVMASIPDCQDVATLDLRIDYLQPATPGVAIHGSAECYKMTRTIAFVRGAAFHEDKAAPIAHATGTFVFATAAVQAAQPAADLRGGQPC
ncbi:MAG: PaaI family thioesterase [Defluviicoccus sp.]